jgi:phage terminase large subunit-like protein
MGLVHHVGNFLELEDELCTWAPTDKESPNRLDALVWGITYLSERGSGTYSVGR